MQNIHNYNFKKYYKRNFAACILECSEMNFTHRTHEIRTMNNSTVTERQSRDFRQRNNVAEKK